MRLKKRVPTGAADLFRARLDQIINTRHELVQLAERVDSDWLEGEIAPLYSEQGWSGIETRFVIGLLLLKHIFALSDEQVCERWVYDPYFQHFTGEEFFQHAFPHERSDLSHWRKRLGDKLDLLLAESLRVAHEAGALRTGPQARHRGHDRPAKGDHVPDRRQASACCDQGLGRLAPQARGAAAPVLCARRKADGDNGGALRPRQTVQAPSAGAALPARAAWPPHPRHRPQDCRPAGTGRGVRAAAIPGAPDLRPAAAPARVEACERDADLRS